MAKTYHVGYIDRDPRIPRSMFHMMCGVFLIEFTGLNGEHDFYTVEWWKKATCSECLRITMSLGYK